MGESLLDFTLPVEGAIAALFICRRLGLCLEGADAGAGGGAGLLLMGFASTLLVSVRVSGVMDGATEAFDAVTGTDGEGVGEEDERLVERCAGSG